MDSIWFFWDSEKVPPIVSRCIRQAKKYSEGRKVILVTLDNMYQYIDLPEIIKDRISSGIIPITHISDMIRTYIMATYGGIYLDATILMTRPIPEEWHKYEFYTVKVKDYPSAYTNVSNAERSVFFFMCKKGDVMMQFICNMLEVYFTKFKYWMDYFLLDYLWNVCYTYNSDVKMNLDKIPYSDDTVLSFLSDGYDKISRECSVTEYRDMIRSLDLPIIKLSAKSIARAPERTANGKFTLKGCIINVDI